MNEATCKCGDPISAKTHDPNSAHFEHYYQAISQFASALREESRRQT